MEESVADVDGIGVGEHVADLALLAFCSRDGNLVRLDTEDHHVRL